MSEVNVRSPVGGCHILIFRQIQASKSATLCTVSYYQRDYLVTLRSVLKVPCRFHHDIGKISVLRTLFAFERGTGATKRGQKPNHDIFHGTTHH